jgi:hypothetical protein
VNAPKYAIIPDEINTSPVKFTYTIDKFSDSAFHLVFSPPRPFIKLFALINLYSQSRTLSSNAFFSSYVFCNLFFKTFTLSMISFNSACFTFKTFITSAYFYSAIASYSFLGFTTLFTL